MGKFSSNWSHILGGGPGQQRGYTVKGRGAVVGRNDPCPCGSGKKFKRCHMPVGSRSAHTHNEIHAQHMQVTAAEQKTIDAEKRRWDEIK